MGGNRWERAFGGSYSLLGVYMCISTVRNLCLCLTSRHSSCTCQRTWLLNVHSSICTSTHQQSNLINHQPSSQSSHTNIMQHTTLLPNPHPNPPPRLQRPNTQIPALLLQTLPYIPSHDPHNLHHRSQPLDPPLFIQDPVLEHGT